MCSVIPNLLVTMHCINKYRNLKVVYLFLRICTLSAAVSTTSLICTGTEPEVWGRGYGGSHAKSLDNFWLIIRVLCYHPRKYQMIQVTHQYQIISMYTYVCINTSCLLLLKMPK
jgi:hypothetical protein